MALRHEEAWRPRAFVAPRTVAAARLAAVRRCFDLQAASLWRDLCAELPYLDGAVLDVGCGAQPYRALLPHGVRYLGIDTIDAKERFDYEVPDTTYFSGSVWPVESCSVDAVLATETLEHVFDTRQFLRECARCLRPGGRLLLTVPFAARWHYVPHDYWRFTPSSLGLLLEQAGFDDVAVYARGNEITVACYKVMALILPILFPQRGSGLTRAILRLVALPLIPLFATLALIGNVSLRGSGGDDCLGYTVAARRAQEKK